MSLPGYVHGILPFARSCLQDLLIGDASDVRGSRDARDGDDARGRNTVPAPERPANRIARDSRNIAVGRRERPRTRPARKAAAR